MSSVSGLSKPHRVEARSRAVHAALLGFKKNPHIHYTQSPARWEGISQKRIASREDYPRNADCSSFVTWCLWNGLYVPFATRDTVNGTDWGSGYTGTMLNHGKRVSHLSSVQRGDCVIYGHSSTGDHTAIVVGRRNGQIMVVSHGSEDGPYYVRHDYRNDVMEIRRYI
jgi:hypothetical protein